MLRDVKNGSIGLKNGSIGLKNGSKTPNPPKFHYL